MVDRSSNRSTRTNRIHNVSTATAGRSQQNVSSSALNSSQGNFTYNADKVVGNGTFGVVYQATIAETGRQVAIKKVFQDPRYRNRELDIMKSLEPHPNLITLLHAFYTSGDKKNELYLNVVMDFIPLNLYQLIKRYKRMRQPIPDIIVKVYAYQIMRSLAHLHASGVCHRDIKPQNFLADTDQHIIKLCDFGSAKRLVRGEPNVSYICSRYYRAPELIFGATDYKTTIDVWSAGCVIAEIILGQPLFPGESGVDQLVEIIKVLGTPTREQIHAMNPNYSENRFPEIRQQPWNRIFRSRTPQDAIDFIASLLVYDPEQRPNAMEALAHPYFDELRTQGCVLPNGDPLPPLFNWTEREMEAYSPDLIQRLTPSWSISSQARGNHVEH